MFSSASRSGSRVRPALAATSAVAALSGALVLGCSVSAVPADTVDAPAQIVASGASTASPQEYVQEALNAFDGGYWANGTAWDQARARAVEQTRSATDTPATYPALAAAIQVAGGPRSRLVTPDRRTRSTRPDPSAPAPAVGVDDGIATVTVPGLGHLAAADRDTADSYTRTLGHGIAQAAPSASCGWVVDLRAADGTQVYPIIAGVSALLPDGPAIGFQANSGAPALIALTGTTLTSQGRVVAAHQEGGAKISAPVAVLTDGATAGAGEAAVVAFKGRAHTRAFGRPTAGSPTATTAIPLSDGVVAHVVTAADVDRSGITYADAIHPDETVAHPAADVAAATNWLRAQCRS